MVNQLFILEIERLVLLLQLLDSGRFLQVLNWPELLVDVADYLGHVNIVRRKVDELLIRVDYVLISEQVIFQKIVLLFNHLLFSNPYEFFPFIIVSSSISYLNKKYF